MKTIDEMLHLDLLTTAQHQEIAAWISRSNSPDDIMRMPLPLWRAVEHASHVMGMTEDLLQPPPFDAGNLGPG